MINNLDIEYKKWIENLKDEIQKSQIKAALTLNSELIFLYWKIGSSISHKVSEGNWGSSIVDNISKDLRNFFPNQKGFSRSNLFSMKKFFEFYSNSDLDTEFVQQLVGQIPWGHNVLIINKITNVDEAFFYINKTVENNWSRNVLHHQIDMQLYLRTGKAVTNFQSTLPAIQSELAIESLKDPYKFDFLMLTEKVIEKDIEEQLVNNISKFLLELGAGFSFVGRQVPIKVDGEDFYLDLLFYHIKLKCYVVIELKSVEFKAEYAGKMNFYLSAVDDLIKSDDENPTIGLLLCKSKSKIIAEYSLRGTTQPIGIAEYELNKLLTDKLTASLPSIETIEKELSSNITSSD